MIFNLEVHNIYQYYMSHIRPILDFFKKFFHDNFTFNMIDFSFSILIIHHGPMVVWRCSSSRANLSG